MKYFSSKHNLDFPVFDLVLCSIDTIWKCLTPAGHPNSKSKKKDSLQVWTGCTTMKFSQITLSRTICILLDPYGEKEWWEWRHRRTWWRYRWYWNEIGERWYLLQKVKKLGIRETWGREWVISMEQTTWIQFRFGIIQYLIHCNFLSFVTALHWKWPLEGWN